MSLLQVQESAEQIRAAAREFGLWEVVGVLVIIGFGLLIFFAGRKVPKVLGEMADRNAAAQDKLIELERTRTERFLSALKEVEQSHAEASKNLANELVKVIQRRDREEGKGRTKSNQ